MTIAVTGASGHIGNVICRMLIEAGHRVKALYHCDPLPLEGLPLERISGNVLVRANLMALFEGSEAVIHAAALISIQGDPDGRVFHTNTTGTQTALEAAIACRVKRFIHLSSVHAVTEIPHHLPYNEHRPYKTAASAAYDHSKARSEQLLLEGAGTHPIELVIVRPSCVIGPFDFKPSSMGAALLDLYHQKLPLLPPGGYDLVDVRDVAGSVIRAAESDIPGGIYLLSGKYYNFKVLAQAVGRVTGKRMPRTVIPYGLLSLLLPLAAWQARITGAAPSLTRESLEAVRNGHPRMDSSKAQRVLGHRCRPLEESLADFFNWRLHSKEWI